MVPLTSDARCGTVATTWRSWPSCQARTSEPITLTLPVLASYRRGISETSVDLPLPVPPIMPSVLPNESSRVTSLTALAAPAPNEKLAWSKLSAGAGASTSVASAWGSATGSLPSSAMLGTQLSTSLIRDALALALVKTTTRLAT